MKYLLYLLFLLPVTVVAQLKTTVICDPFYVDLLDGNVNKKVEPDFSAARVKKAFPCFTSEVKAGDSSKCGEAVFYRDKDLYFYCGRGYIEIRERFSGKLSIPLMGAPRTGLFKWLGVPKLRDKQWDAFGTSYGILILYYNKSGRVNLIRLSKLSTETLSICE